MELYQNRCQGNLLAYSARTAVRKQKRTPVHVDSPVGIGLYIVFRTRLEFGSCAVNKT